MASRRQYSPTPSQSSLSLSRTPSPSDDSRDGFAPPVPPRAGTIHLTPYSNPPPPYSKHTPENQSQPLTHSWSSQDPRSSSTQSLVPADSARDGRRTLLLIYIHGFMGNESSFRSFPAHVHNLVTVMMADTHAVHTKIYPRYKSRRAIEYARDDFSNWLCPHESPETDVILLGHSMGGILSAEVALLAPYSAASRELFRHRILGTISFDTPFLGMHPGVVVSGIGSLFRPAADPPGMQSPQSNGGHTPSRPTASAAAPPSSQAGDYFDLESTDADGVVSPFASTPNDPNYNPPFPNDVRTPIRTGWDNAMHFITKHSDGLTRATTSYVTSHLEFGGCLADYKGLRTRYARLRALEDVDELGQDRDEGDKLKRRVRFVNYYTASTGRGKLHEPAGRHPEQRDRSPRPMEIEMRDMSLSNRLPTSTARSMSRSPRISVEEHREGQVLPHALQDPDETITDTKAHQDDAWSEENEGMNDIDPSPINDSASQYTQDETTQPVPSLPETNSPHPHSKTLSRSATDTPPDLSSLPPIPPIPTTPPPFDPTPYTDKDTRKLAEKEHARRLKTHQRALQDRANALNDRRKLLEKRAKKARQERDKQAKSAEKQVRAAAKQRLRDEKALLKRAASDSKASPSSPSGLTPENTKMNEKEKEKDNDNNRKPRSSRDGKREKHVLVKPVPKPPRDRRFCVLPPRNGDGERDPCWVRVYMEGVDEVGAHCGLFFAGGTQYERLVGDVGERVAEWVREGDSVRVVRELWEGERKGGDGEGVGVREGWIDTRFL